MTKGRWRKSGGRAGKECVLSWGDWTAWGGVTVPFDAKLNANLQLAYTDSKIFAATADVKYTPVKGIVVTPEVTYTNFDSINNDLWAGILRFRRSF